MRTIKIEQIRGKLGLAITFLELEKYGAAAGELRRARQQLTADTYREDYDTIPVAEENESIISTDTMIWLQGIDITRNEQILWAREIVAGTPKETLPYEVYSFMTTFAKQRLSSGEDDI